MFSAQLCHCSVNTSLAMSGTVPVSSKPVQPSSAVRRNRHNRHANGTSADANVQRTAIFSSRQSPDTPDDFVSRFGLLISCGGMSRSLMYFVTPQIDPKGAEFGDPLKSGRRPKKYGILGQN